MVEAILSYVIKAIDESSSVMDKIKSSVGLLGSSLGELGGGFTAVGSVMTGFAAGGVAGAAISAIGQIAQGLEWSVKEAADSEQAFKNLGEAVNRSGTAWTSVEGATREYLTQLQATTVYSDEALAGMVERLLTFGMTYEQAMAAAGTALDLAAAKHMDLESAASLVGKAIDGNTAILKRYGVDVEVAKDATDKFTPVITALNEQFGGAAQAQAQTYAGIQERLKNATSELGEKIGGILLPSLASVTEAMIPVVDQFGKGVDAIQAWLTEVSKMPEVQGAVAAVNDAFSVLWKYLGGLWSFFVEQMGPALTELMSAFRDLWDALSPIGDAIRELLGAFGDTGNLDLFKAVIMAIVIEIRGIAAIIKEVSPYIKAFAQAFKDAADFIKPILTTMVGDVRSFLDALEKAFHDFYNWLIGASLWRDLWTAMSTLTTQMVSQLLTTIRDSFLHLLQTTFETVTQAIKSAWDTAWTAMQTIFTTASTMMQNAWTDWTTAMQNTMTNFWSAIQAMTSNALTAVQSAFSSAMATVQGILSSAISTMQGMWQGFASFMSNAIATFQSAVSGASSFLSSTLAGMQAAASSTLNSIQGMISSAWSTVTSAASSMASTIASTVSQASTAVSTVTSSLPSEIPTGPILAPSGVGPYIMGETTAPATTPVASPTTPPLSPTTLNATIPVTVKVDSQTVATQVENRIVSSATNRSERRY
jgi:phage-related protein